MIKKIISPTLITCCVIVFSALSLNAQSTKVKSTTTIQANSIVKKEDSTAKLTPYQKLFDKKRSVKTSAGIVTLHIVDGKLYFELPIKLIEKSFLMSSLVDNVSNMSLSYAGQRASKPQHICFTKTDSLVQICLVPVTKIVDSRENGIREAVERSSLPSVLVSKPILAYNADSSAVVFDATSFFVSDSKYIGALNASSFGGFIQKVSTFSKELSALKDVESYHNNLSVISDMTYTFKTFFLGMESGGVEYATVELRTTLMLLPEEKFRHRYGDYRIGTSVTEFEKFDSKIQGSEINYLANRWRLEPKDANIFQLGGLTEPKKQIVFYIDTLFVPEWREAIKSGLLKWNDAFEKIGFKDVIQVLDFPSKSQDPKLSAGNIAYNCVRYAQTPSRNIGRQINIDPRTGEILSASILFFRDSPVTLQRERIYQTAAVEPSVRGYELPQDLMCSSIEMAMMREMGFCLGLTANLAGSSWMPVDSLRSATFTQREGITSSVMDQIRYNYIAQPGDIEKGVKLTADNLGVYDYYAIKWLYKPIFKAKTPSAEVGVLKEMISEKINDPRYFYGKEQSWSAYFDPRSVIEDLGNDKIKAAKYGINTLKYVAGNATKWVNKDEVDESYRELFIDFIFLKLYDYYRSVMVNIGGIEINRKYEGDPMPSYKVLDRKIQKESLLYLLNQSEDLAWVDNKDLLIMSGMNPNFSSYLANNLVKLAFQRVAMVAFAQNLNAKKNNAGQNPDEPYTLDEMFGDLIQFSLKNMSKGLEPTEAQIATLFNTAQFLLANANLPNVIKAKAKNSAAFQFTDEDNFVSYRNVRARCFPNENFLSSVTEEDSFAMTNGPGEENGYEKSGFEQLSSLKFLINQNLSDVYYKHLLDLRAKLKVCLKKAKSQSSTDRIAYLMLSIDKGLGE